MPKTTFSINGDDPIDAEFVTDDDELLTDEEGDRVPDMFADLFQSSEFDDDLDALDNELNDLMF